MPPNCFKNSRSWCNWMTVGSGRPLGLGSKIEFMNAREATYAWGKGGWKTKARKDSSFAPQMPAPTLCLTAGCFWGRNEVNAISSFSPRRFASVLKNLRSYYSDSWCMENPSIHYAFVQCHLAWKFFALWACAFRIPKLSTVSRNTFLPLRE